MRHYIGLCLLLAGNAVSQNAHTPRDNTGEENVLVKLSPPPPEEMENILRGWFADGHPMFAEDIVRYKETTGVTDDALRAVLLDIYQSVRHLADVPFQRGEPRKLTSDRWRLRRSIQWLGHCADEPTKRLLLDFANDETKVRNYRIYAVDASIQCAAAQEVRDVLLHFFADKKLNPYGTYWHAEKRYDEAEANPQKQEAILATVIALLARDEDKDVFAEMDKKVAERSKEYATSSQRLAMIQRMSKLPPSRHRDTDNDLKTAQKSFRFRLFKTNVSTNMTELMARDFRKPVEVKKE